MTLSSPAASEKHVRIVQQAQTRQRPKTVGGMAESSVINSFGNQVPYYVVLDEKFKTNKANVQPRQRMPTYPAYEAPHMRCEDLGLLVEPKPASTRQLSLSKFANRPHPANQKQKDEGWKSFQLPPTPARKKASTACDAPTPAVVLKNRRQVFPSTGAYMPGDTNKHDLKIPSLARPKFTPKQEQWIQEHVQATRSHSLQPKAVYRPVQHHLYKTKDSVSDEAAEDSAGQWRLEMNIMRHHSVKVDPSPVRQQQRKQHQQEQLQRSASFVSLKKSRPEMAFHSPPSPSRSSPRINMYDSKHIVNPLALSVDMAYEGRKQRSQSSLFPPTHNQYPHRPQTVPTQPHTSREMSEAPPPRLYHPRSPNNAYEKSVGYSNVAADPVAFHRIRYSAPVESIQEAPLVMSTHISRRVLTPQGQRARAQAAQIKPVASSFPASTSLSPYPTTLVRGHTPTAPKITIKALGSSPGGGASGQTLYARQSTPSMTSSPSAAPLVAGGVAASSDTKTGFCESASDLLSGVITSSNNDVGPDHKDVATVSMEKESSQLCAQLPPIAASTEGRYVENASPANPSKAPSTRTGDSPDESEVPELKKVLAKSSETRAENNACTPTRETGAALKNDPETMDHVDSSTCAGVTADSKVETNAVTAESQVETNAVTAESQVETNAVVNNASKGDEMARSSSPLIVTTVTDSTETGSPVNVLEVMQSEDHTIRDQVAPTETQPMTVEGNIMKDEIIGEDAAVDKGKEGDSVSRQTTLDTERDDSKTGCIEGATNEGGDESQEEIYSQRNVEGEGVEWKVDPLGP